MSPPLTPDAEEARRQLADELTKPIYADVQSWLSDQLDKLLDWLTGGDSGSGTMSTGQLAAIAIVVTAVAAVALWAIMGPVRTERRRRRAEVFANDEHTADQLRAGAAALAAREEWGQATMQVFRAMVRSLGERVVIDESTGMTAHEAAARAAVRLPVLEDRLAHAADVFDALAYGRRPGSRTQYEDMCALDAAVADTRPTVAAAPAGEQPAVAVEPGR